MIEKSQKRVVDTALMLPEHTVLQQGRYRIERPLASGAYSNTYAGIDVSNNETVAIKEFFVAGLTGRDTDGVTAGVYDAADSNYFQIQRERFKAGARRLRQFRNESMVRVLDVFEEYGTAYYVMKFIDGETLEERLARLGKPLSENNVRRYLNQILSALNDLHDHSIWHLDLNPSHIMLDIYDRAVLIGFNAGKLLAADTPPAKSQLPKAYNEAYEPAELVNGDFEHIDARTDIYALGMTLYAILTNQRPPASETLADNPEAMHWPERVKPQLQHLVARMTNPNREAGLKSVDSVREYLGNSNDDIGGGGDGWLKKLLRWGKLLLIVIVLGLVVFGIVKWCSSGGEEVAVPVQPAVEQPDSQKQSEPAEAKQAEDPKSEEPKEEEKAKDEGSSEEEKAEEAKEEKPAEGANEDYAYMKKSDRWSATDMKSAQNKAIFDAFKSGNADAIINHPYSQAKGENKPNGYWTKIVNDLKKLKEQYTPEQLSSIVKDAYRDPLDLVKANDVLHRKLK